MSDASDAATRARAAATNPYPEQFTDAEWRQVMAQYGAWRDAGFLKGSFLEPYPFLSFQPFADRPTVFFDHQGTPSLTPMPSPDPGMLRDTLRTLRGLLNHRFGDPPALETRPASTSPRSDDGDVDPTSSVAWGDPGDGGAS